MKYSAVAVALAGVAVADSTLSVQWETWSSTTPVEETSTYSTWNTWSTPVEETSTTQSWNTWSTPVEETSTTQSWNTWSTPVEETSTSSTWNTWSTPVSETSTQTWNTWSTPVSETSTQTWNSWTTPAETSKTCSYVTEVATKKCDKHGCWDDKYTTTVYVEAETCTWAAWTGTPVEETSTQTWATWNTWSTPVEETSTQTWATWSTWETPVEETSTYNTWNTWSTPVEETSTQTWATWSTYETPVEETSTWASWESTTTVEEYTTQTWSTWATPVYTKSVEAGWSQSGWFGPAWPTAGQGQCVSNVVTSYGAPTWAPTAEASWSTWSTPANEVQTGTWSSWSGEAQTATWSSWAAEGTGYTTIPSHGNKWSMTYTPYNAQGKCKTEDVIKGDIANIAKLGFKSVRVYSTDCHTLEWVGSACKESNLKMILGVFIDESGVKGAGKQVTDIIAWKQWDLVEIIVIGNEAVQSGFCSAEDLAWFIKDCKAKFAAAGYTGPCTTTEPLDQWQKYGSQFCGVVDVVSANLYAYFNPDCEASGAGDFIEKEIVILEGICPKKEVYVMECGWPKEGECNGKACPSVENQKTAITSIQEKCGDKIVWFSYEDEVWKQPGQFNVEQHWGCAEVFGDVAWSNYGTSPAATATSTWNTWATPAPTVTSTWATWSSAEPTTTATWGSY